MRFGELVKHTDPGLVISRRHEDWVVLNDAHPSYSQEALSFGLRQLAGTDRVRVGTVSASSLGECLRYQQFVFLGMPKLGWDAKSAMKVQNGSYMHLRWQMEGLSEGWLSEAEVPLPANHYRLSGTMDGIAYDDSVVELKSTNLNGFSRVQTFGPMIPHLFQMATYLLASRREKGLFLYECKDNQEYKEIVVTPEELPMAEVAAQAESLWAAIDAQQLFEPLEKCLDGEGWVYNSCPFRDRCIQIHRWEEVAE